MFEKAKDYFMGPPLSPLEKKLVFKLDFFILTFCCLAYFMNYLDRMNITQAYVSGMKEELNFQGADLTVVNTVYACAYLGGIVPNNILLTYIRPRYFFPAMMTIWAGLCMCNAAARSPKDMMAIRFFQGYFESCIFAGTHYLLGSWYTKQELGKRSGLFTASGLAGGMFGGFMQTGIHQSMDGLRGMAGWRWLYIIDGIITLPIALYGFLVFPDTPATTQAKYLSEEERALARQRVVPIEGEKILTKSFFHRLFSNYYFYAYVVLWILGNCSEAFSSQSLLNLYMKSHPTITYSVAQLNNYPTGVQAVGIVSTLLWAASTDIYGRRWLSGYFNAITGICTSIIILAPKTTTAGVFGAYYWAAAIYCCQATFFAWANDAMRNEPHTMRAFIIAAMNCGGNTFQAFWPLIFYRADDAPMFTRGMWGMIGVSICLAIWVTVMVFLERRKNRKNAGAVLDSMSITDSSKPADMDKGQMQDSIDPESLATRVDSTTK